MAFTGPGSAATDGKLLAAWTGQLCRVRRPVGEKKLYHSSRQQADESFLLDRGGWELAPQGILSMSVDDLTSLTLAQVQQTHPQLWDSEIKARSLRRWRPIKLHYKLRLMGHTPPICLGGLLLATGAGRRPSMVAELLLAAVSAALSLSKTLAFAKQSQSKSGFGMSLGKRERQVAAK